MIVVYRATGEDHQYSSHTQINKIKKRRRRRRKTKKEEDSVLGFSSENQITKAEAALFALWANCLSLRGGLGGI
jgi:hypothetical protein